MPSPFAKTLQTKNTLLERIAPAIVVAVVLILCGVLYSTQWTTTQPATNTMPSVKKRPIISYDERTAVLITKQGKVKLSSPSPYEENSMFYRTGGIKEEPIFILIHSPTRGSSSKDWNHLYEIIAHQGTYYAIDLINYGDSEPNPQTQKRIHLHDEQANHVIEFIQTLFPNPNNKNIILVAKDEASTIACSVASRLTSQIKGLFFIAPEYFNDMSDNIETIPMFLMWAKEDKIVPFSKASSFEKNFIDVTTFYIESILEEGVAVSEAHNPETLRGEQLAFNLEEWINILQYRD